MKFVDYEKPKNKDRKDQVKSWIANFDFDVAFLVSEARLHAGLTQAQLAKHIGTQQPSIARVEGGKHLPSLELLKRIALAIGTSLIAPKFGFMAPGISSTTQVIVKYRIKKVARYYPVFAAIEPTTTRTFYPQSAPVTI